MSQKEKHFQLAARIVMILFLLINVALGIYYVTLGKVYNFTLLFCAVLLPVLLKILYRILKFQRVYQLDILIYLFFFTLYTIGLATNGYHYIPYYDKFAHTFSGVFTSYLALILFYVLKPVKKIEKSDFSLVSVFTLAVAVAVAGIWEIAEYITGLICGTDPQNVLTTGVADTMWDIIVCAFGALFMIVPYFLYYKKEKKDLFMQSFELMFYRNIQKQQ